MFFHDATCKQTRAACKILTFFEDLNFLNPRSHLKHLKLVSAIFYQFFIYHQMIALQKI